MSNLTIAASLDHSSEPLSARASLELYAAIHVHSRAERFLFKNSLSSSDIPLSYVRILSNDRSLGLSVIDKSFTVVTNKNREEDYDSKEDIFLGSSYTTTADAILATNRAGISQSGKTVPLWYAHDLPPSTVEAEIIRIMSSDDVEEFVYEIDLSVGVIYCNHGNRFDRNTKTIKELFQVSSTDSTGVLTKSILDIRPSASEATYEDIDPVTGEFLSNKSLYTKTVTGSSVAYSLSPVGLWYVQSYKQRISLGVNTLNSLSSRWVPFVTNGKFVTNVNSTEYVYSVPEYYDATYGPYIPHRQILSETLSITLDKKALFSERSNLSTVQRDEREIEILAYNETSTLVEVWTTNPALHDTYYGNTTVKYNAQRVYGLDRKGGIFLINMLLNEYYSYQANYYYEAYEYDMSAIDLNPANNIYSAFGMLYVFYLVPNRVSGELSIFYLMVDREEQIVECSQPELALKNEDGTFNTNTCIGMFYSEIGFPNFIETYSSKSAANTFQYMILGEVSYSSVNSYENVKVTEMLRPYKINDDYREIAAIANPKLQQNNLLNSRLSLPRENVVIVQVPIQQHIDYGGTFTRESMLAALYKRIPSTVYIVLEWAFPKPIASFYVEDVGAGNYNVVITAGWSPEATGYEVSITSSTHGAVVTQLPSTGLREDQALTLTDSYSTDELLVIRASVIENGYVYPPFAVYKTKVP